LVKSKNQAEMKFISDLLKKLGVSSSVLEMEEIEDLGMAKLLKKVDRNKKVSRELIMKKLKS
jgi:reverse gyrase